MTTTFETMTAIVVLRERARQLWERAGNGTVNDPKPVRQRRARLLADAAALGVAANLLEGRERRDVLKAVSG